jgi:hypothetical protein
MNGFQSWGHRNEPPLAKRFSTTETRDDTFSLLMSFPAYLPMEDPYPTLRLIYGAPNLTPSL